MLCTYFANHKGTNSPIPLWSMVRLFLHSIARGGGIITNTDLSLRKKCKPQKRMLI